MLQSTTKINQYIITKLLNTGDYQARDQFQNQYLISPASSFQNHIINQQITLYDSQSQLLNPYQTITINQQATNALINKYICYRIPPKSMWIGQLSTNKLKSQLYCISLIYNAVNLVLKPLLGTFNQKALFYLHSSNIWIKNHQLYLILRPRQPKNIIIQTSFLQNLQTKLLKKFGEIMSEFIQIQKNNKLASSIFLTSLFHSLSKQQVSFSLFDRLMNDKKFRLQYQNQVKSSFHYQILQQKNNRPNNHPNRRYLLQKFQKPNQSMEEEKERSNSTKQKNKTKYHILPPSFQRHNRKIFDIFNINNRKMKKKAFSVSVTHNFDSIQDGENISSLKKTILSKGNTDYASIYQNQDKFHKKKGYSIRTSILIDKITQKALKKFQQPKINQNRLDQNIKTIIQNKNRTLSIDNYIRIQPQYFNKQNFETLNQYQYQQEYINNKSNLEQKLISITKKSLETYNKQLSQVNIRQKNVQLKKSKQKVQQLTKKQQKPFQITENQSQHQILINKINQNKYKNQTNIQQSSFFTVQQPPFNFSIIPQKSIIDKNQIKNFSKKQQVIKNKEVQKQIKIQPKPQVKQKFQINQTKKNNYYKNNIQSYDDEIEQIRLVQPSKNNIQNKNNLIIEKNMQIDKSNQIKTVDSQAKQKKQVIKPQQKKQGVILPQYPPKPKPIQEQFYQKKSQRKSQPKKQSKNQHQIGKRVNTNQSSTGSSYGPKKPLVKHISQYIMFINKIGQGVAKSSKLSKKLQEVQWYTGVYFVYKRFFYQRKQIQKWIQKGEPKLSRYGNINIEEWKQWLAKDQRQELLKKTKEQNCNIDQSIQKMCKKILKKNLPGKVLFHTNLERNSFQQSKIAVQYVVDQFDQLCQKKKLDDPQLLSHISDLINCLFIIAEIDGKITQKKPLSQFSTKLTLQKLKQMSDKIYDLYQL